MAPCWIVFNSMYCYLYFCRPAIDKMQSACLNEYGDEKAVDFSTQETTIIQHIFRGRLQSQVSYVSTSTILNMYLVFFYPCFKQPLIELHSAMQMLQFISM